MAQFRRVVGNDAITNWWDDGEEAVAFGRGSKGFFALLNNVNKHLKETAILTALPDGIYCDIISGELIG